MYRKIGKSYFLLMAVVVLLLTSCVGTAVETRQNLALQVAQGGHMRSFTLTAMPFVLTGFERVMYPGEEAVLYIEGDGLAWRTKNQVSLDPTPVNPMALKLSSIDTSRNVTYLARPCQYSKWLGTGACPMKYWTSNRFDETVISAYDDAMDQLKTRFDIKGFHLIGFSGGAAVSALIAARRDDVLSLRTVAGNLDHVALHKWHKVTQTPESLNPIDFAGSLGGIPQIHFVGSEDDVVKPFISEGFISALPPGSCARQVLVKGAEHNKGWDQLWLSLQHQMPGC